MKKLLLCSLAAVLSLGILSSCKKDEEKEIVITAGEKVQTVYADDNSGSDKILFKTTGAWTSTITEETGSPAPWLTIDQTNGEVADDYTVNIALEKNYTGANRTATIVLSGVVDRVEITITQKSTTNKAKVLEYPESIRIGNTIWATRNVAEPGTFTDHFWDYGNLFFFDEALTACPPGWRVPTHEELQSLIDFGVDEQLYQGWWAMFNGVRGRWFGDGDNRVFFPAAGLCLTLQYWGLHEILSVGEGGYYWSSVSYYPEHFNNELAWNLHFVAAFTPTVGHGSRNKSDGLSIRCVAE